MRIVVCEFSRSLICGNLGTKVESANRRLQRQRRGCSEDSGAGDLGTEDSGLAPPVTPADGRDFKKGLMCWCDCSDPMEVDLDKDRRTEQGTYRDEEAKQKEDDEETGNALIEICLL